MKWLVFVNEMGMNWIYASQTRFQRHLRSCIMEPHTAGGKEADNNNQKTKTKPDAEILKMTPTRWVTPGAETLKLIPKRLNTPGSRDLEVDAPKWVYTNYYTLRLIPKRWNTPGSRDLEDDTDKMSYTWMAQRH